MAENQSKYDDVNILMKVPKTFTYMCVIKKYGNRYDKKL